MLVNWKHTHTQEQKETRRNENTFYFFLFKKPINNFTLYFSNDDKTMRKIMRTFFFLSCLKKVNVA